MWTTPLWTVKEDGARAPGTIVAIHGAETSWLLPVHPAHPYVVLINKLKDDTLTISLKKVAGG